jgi:hypothetical protein
MAETSCSRLPSLSLAHERGAPARPVARSGCANRCLAFLGAMYPKADWAPRRCCAPRPPSRRWRAIRSRATSTISRSCRRQRGQLYSESFKRELAGYRAIEVFQRYAANAPVEDPLSLVQYLDIQDLPGRGHPHQGRPRQHGARPRGARADPRSRVHGVGLQACRHDIKLKGQTASTSSRRRWSPPAERRAVPAEDGVRGSAGAVVPRAAEAAREGCRCSATAMADSGLFDMGFVASWSTSTSRGRRDHSTRCGHS